jgi:hypothetical protein
LLTGVDGAGRPQTEPCDDSQPDAEHKQQGRRLRRGPSARSGVSSATESGSAREPDRQQPPAGPRAAQAGAPADEAAESEVDEPPFAL